MEVLSQSRNAYIVTTIAAFFLLRAFMQHTFIIAEVGSCHDGSLDKAKQLIDIAKATGANAVKFQFWSSAARMAQRRKAPEYLSVYKRYAMPVGLLEPLSSYAKARSIEFMCSTYLPEDVDVVAPFVDIFKIASFEANDPQHLVAHVRHLRRNAKAVIVSMGMGANQIIVNRYLLQPFLEENQTTLAVRYFHCVSAYPTPVSELHLLRLRWDYEREQRALTPIGVPMVSPHQFYGFSDHSDASQVLTGALAVSAGARGIERHFCNDDIDPDNPDYGHSMKPTDFKTYVANIRLAEQALGFSQDGHVGSEMPMRAYRVRATDDDRV